jgi:hypothetical protein
MTNWATRLALWATLAVVAGCTALSPRATPSPQQRPPGIVPGKPPVARALPSDRSLELASYYGRLQSDLLTRGLLRTDGGGPDTPFTADDLVDNFIEIAFFDEYGRPGVFSRRSRGGSGALTRWTEPVRLSVEFGPTIPSDIRDRDRSEVNRFAGRLARVTKHPISVAAQNANFTVFVAGEDDRPFIQRRLKELIPGISDNELALFENLPRSFYCLVAAVPGQGTPNTYARAVALVRAEHPDLVRKSCLHEEISQGLGLPNDSPDARPSIFNDDDEFAFLTSHDELLLRMLYDSRLKPGMTADEARPIARTIATELLGPTL